jgi:copper chaperone NosL
MLYSWVGLLVLLAGAGMVDFWLWEYDYGHNLNPEAAIKIPGMSYQPPLIGSKMLLNFNASSWPALGGWIAIGAGALATLVAVGEFRRGRKPGGQALEGEQA